MTKVRSNEMPTAEQMCGQTNGTIVRDKEIAALNRIAKLFDALDPAARQRVVQWVAAKYLFNENGQ